MNWLNLEIKILCAEEFLGSDPTDRATWLCLLRFCAQQENDGIIKDCHGWGARKWPQLTGVMKEEVKKNDSLLWKWIGEDLHVWEYPLSQQIATQAKRKGGKDHGRGQASSKKGDKKPPKKPAADPKIEMKAYAKDMLATMDKERVDLYKEWFVYKSAAKHAFKTLQGLKAFFTKTEAEFSTNEMLEDAVQNSKAGEYQGLFASDNKSSKQKRKSSVDPKKDIGL